VIVPSPQVVRSDARNSVLLDLVFRVAPLCRLVEKRVPDLAPLCCVHCEIVLTGWRRTTRPDTPCRWSGCPRQVCPSCSETSRRAWRELELELGGPDALEDGLQQNSALHAVLFFLTFSFLVAKLRRIREIDCSWQSIFDLFFFDGRDGLFFVFGFFLGFDAFFFFFFFLRGDVNPFDQCGAELFVGARFETC
jgi:hypothetical protein